MLFWIFVMLVVIGIICFIIYENTMFNDEWVFDIGVIFEIFGWLVFLVSLVIGFVTSV